MLNPVVATAFEHVQGPGDIARHVGVRVLERIAHPRLRGEVHDALEFLAPEEVRHAAVVGEIELDETKTRQRLEPREPRPLQVHVVVVVEVVEPHDFIAARDEALRDMRADEPRSTGDEDLHARLTGARRPGRP